MAQMLEDRFCDNVLFVKLKKTLFIDLIEQRTVSEIIDLDSKKHLTLDNNSKLQTSLLVASDGIDSPTAKASGIRKTGWKYKQRGLVCAVNHEYSSNNTAYQYFLLKARSYFTNKE